MLKRLARFQQWMIYFSFSSFLSTKWSPRLFLFSLSLCDIKILVSLFSKISWIYTMRLCKQKFPNISVQKVPKVVVEGGGGNHHSLCNLSEKWFQGIINCRSEAEMLVQSFQLVHPISLVLNPSWWVTRFHRMFSSHKMPCQVPQHNTCRYVLIMPGCFKISCMKSTEHIYMYNKLCQFVK
jgi:hypothetical protein